MTTIQVRRTYKYRLYRSDRNKHLHDVINVSGIIWNHITALRKRYYRLFKKHISEGRLKEHVAKLRREVSRFQYWQMVGSQAVQDICERHEEAYQKFFNGEGRLPRFKKVKKYKSFTLKQKAGWKLHDRDAEQKPRGSEKHPKLTGCVTILGRQYKFVKHRPLNGDIKTVTVKRDAAGRLWVCFSVVETISLEDEISTGRIGGFDFGLKTFLTTDEGIAIQAPLFFTQDLPRLRQIQQQVSKKVDGSRNQQRGKQHLARRHIRIADKRRDFHFQLAHELCDHYDVMCFETLNIEAMKQLWGRKVSDLGFAQFIKILKWMARKRGKRVVFIGQWERTTGKCSQCGHGQKLTLDQREFCCQRCGFTLDRDHNAARNIVEVGHHLMLSQSIEDLPNESVKASGVNGSGSRL